MKLKIKKGQVASIDFIIAFIVLLLFTSFLISFFVFKIDTRDVDRDSYQLFYDNFKELNSTYSFVKEHKIDTIALENLNSMNEDNYSNYFKKIILNNSELFNPDVSDICIFFTVNNTFKMFTGSLDFETFGYVYDTTDRTSRQQCSFLRPCLYYGETYVIKKPVLIENDAYMMNMLICRI